MFLEWVLLGVGLAMDAFAVSVSKGLSMTKVKKKSALLIALFFGGFQALMPFAGFLLGIGFQQYIESVDHWIAFALLAFIGGKMIYESFKSESDDDTVIDKPLKISELVLMAFATSIDALAVGVTFAFLGYNILQAGCSVSIIGIVTFIISLAGVYIGNFFGSKYKNKAEFAGGLILVLIGAKILLEGLGVINF
ncbi:MAG: manganese efflux pump MntP family protein [Ruminococcus sp.]